MSVKEGSSIGDDSLYRPTTRSEKEKEDYVQAVEHVNPSYDGDVKGRESVSTGDGEARMTTAKWLACVALALAYTTAFQQGSLLGSIVKSIDEDLGMWRGGGTLVSATTIADVQA